MWARRAHSSRSTMSRGCGFADLLAATMSKGVPFMIANISRRSLVKGVAATAATAAAAGSLNLAGGGRQSTVFAAPTLVQSAGSQLEIKYWTTNGSGSEATAEEKLTKDFEAANPGIKITRTLQPSYEDLAASLVAALQTGDEPHLAILSDVWWFRFYLSESIADLTPLLTEAKIDTSDYVQSLFVEYQRNGGQYAVPYGRSTPLLYYNQDALDAAGLDKSIFEKWSTFGENAPRLAGGKTEFAFGFGTGSRYGAWVLQGAVWAFGGHYSDKDFNILIAEAPAVEAGEFFRKSVSDKWAHTSKDPEQDFMYGVNAAVLAGSSAISKFNESAKFTFGTAFLPEEKQFGCCTGGAGLAILKSAPQEVQAASVAYMDFLTNTESTTYWAQTTGYMPVRTSAIESPSEQAYLDKNPNNRISIEQLPKTQPQDSARVFIPNGDQILGNGWEQILVKNIPAQDAFNDVKDQLDQEKEPVLEQIKALEG